MSTSMYEEAFQVARAVRLALENTDLRHNVSRVFAENGQAYIRIQGKDYAVNTTDQALDILDDVIYGGGHDHIDEAESYDGIQ